MEKNIWLKRLVSGVFFILGIMLMVVIVFVIGIDRGLTQPKIQVQVLFNQVGGLIEGAPIRLSGVNVGVVGDVSFLDQPKEGRSLKVVLNIFKKYEFQVKKCSRISIKTEGMLGQKYVEISEDRSRRVFDITRLIIGDDPLDVEDMASTLTRTALAVQGSAGDLKEILNEWKFISRKTKRVINRVEDKLVDGTLFKIF